MDANVLLEAIQKDTPIGALEAIPDDFAKVFAPHVSDLSFPSLMTAVRVCREAKSGRAAGEVLLDLTGHGDAQVSIGAAMALERVVDPPEADALLAVLPIRLDAMVKESLYLTLARVITPGHRVAIRALIADEHDEVANDAAVAAGAKAKGDLERRAFFHRSTQVDPSNAERRHKALVIVNEPDFAPALLTWFDIDAPAYGVGDHRKTVYVRVCDLATHAAAKLGVVFSGAEKISAPDAFPEHWIDDALDAVAKLPIAGDLQEKER